MEFEIYSVSKDPNDANLSFFGFLFLATTSGRDRYYILNESRGGTPEQRAKLEIDQ